jgi:DNA-binding NtrC family response regulator
VNVPTNEAAVPSSEASGPSIETICPSYEAAGASFQAPGASIEPNGQAIEATFESIEMTLQSIREKCISIETARIFCRPKCIFGAATLHFSRATFSSISPKYDFFSRKVHPVDREEAFVATRCSTIEEKAAVAEAIEDLSASKWKSISIDLHFVPSDFHFASIARPLVWIICPFARIICHLASIVLRLARIVGQVGPIAFPFADEESSARGENDPRCHESRPSLASRRPPRRYPVTDDLAKTPAADSSGRRPLARGADVCIFGVRMNRASSEREIAPSRAVLVVDDEPSMLSLLGDDLRRNHYAVSTHTSPVAALRQLADEDFGVMLCDIRMQDMSGIDLCREALALRPDVPVIMMTGFASTESAIDAIRAGAFDFVTKPFRTGDLVLRIERALRHRELSREIRRLSSVEVQPRLGDMVGESAAMQGVYDRVTRVAESDATVLVTGETGTGKELVARALHAGSARPHGPFVAVNCAAVGESLLESELFGHAKGAFTDAIAARAGLLSSADGGTLFLDEVGDMPLAMQAKLLRALQERKVRAVGADREVPFDTRIVAATHRDLEEDVTLGRFRKDLLYRLNVVQLHVPPLRERGYDVLLLAQSFLKRCSPKGRERVSGLTVEAAERLLRYPWPGNVRELQNCIERSVALARFDRLTVEDLPDRIGHFADPHTELANDDEPSTIVSLEELERRHVTRVLETLGGNKTSTAQALGMDRRTLYRKLERWRIT